MKIREFFLAMLIMITVNIHAFGQDYVTVSEKEIVASTVVSFGIQAGTVASAFAYNEEYFPYLFLGLASLQNFPGVIIPASNGLNNTLFQAGFDSLYFINNVAFGENLFTPLLFNSAHKFSMYSTYDTYTDLRQRSKNENYSEIRKYNFMELMLSPFDLTNYKDWYVWGYLGSMGIYCAISIANADQTNAIWKTGESYLGSNRFSVAAGMALLLAIQIPNFIFTGVGEESLYRGVYYEELQYRIGEWPAKITDGVYFTVSHMPQQIEQFKTMKPEQIILDSSLSVLQTFWFQYIYEWGGLKQAVTAHAVSDIILFLADWMLQGGVPNDSGFSINSRILSITANY